jgi:hypothetical protein
MNGPLITAAPTTFNLNTITGLTAAARTISVMVDGMSVSATSGNGQLEQLHS